MSLNKSARSTFPEVIKARGEQCFIEGHVKVTQVKVAELTASVKGTSLYEVSLYIDDDGCDAHCECVYFAGNEHCKHVWATLLAAEHYYEERWNEFDESLMTKKSTGDSAVKASPLWKTQLAQQSLGVQFTYPEKFKKRQFRYTLYKDFSYSYSSRSSSEKVMLRLEAQVENASGKWGKWKRLSMYDDELGQIEKPCDQAVLLQLATPSNDSDWEQRAPVIIGNYELSPILLNRLLPLLNATGALFLANEDNPLTLDEDLNPWQFNVHRKDTEKGMRLSGEFKRGDDVLPVNQERLIFADYLNVDGVLSRIEHRVDRFWINYFMEHAVLEVPKKELEEFYTYAVEKIPDAIRVLQLKKGNQSNDKSSLKPFLKMAERSGFGEPYFVAQVIFWYGDVSLPYGDTSFAHYGKAAKELIERDRVEEATRINELKALSVKEPVHLKNAEYCFELSKAAFAKAVPALVSSGWGFSIDNNAVKKISRLDLKIKSGQDWLDLEAGVELDGVVTKLPPILERAQSSGLVQLEDKSWAIMDPELIASHNLLKELGAEKDGKIRFKQSQSFILDILLSQIPGLSQETSLSRLKELATSFNKIEVLDPPVVFKGKLRRYQAEGFAWLKWLEQEQLGGCLADDMGLGKTIQTLAFLGAKHKQGEKSNASLIVVPRSIISNWEREAQAFLPEAKCLIHSGGKRSKNLAAFDGIDIVLTSYGTLRNDILWLKDYNFETVVLDEAQTIKNKTSQAFKSVCLLQTKQRIALSGTPIENNVEELWSLFHFLNPGLLGTATIFKKLTRSSAEGGEDLKAVAVAIRPFLLRRLKADVAKDLPEKLEQTLYCDLDPAQEKIYDDLKGYYQSQLNKRLKTEGLNKSKIQILEALLRLRQAACHPGLLDTAEQAKSAKLDLLMERLETITAEGHKVLVFSQFTKFLAFVKPQLEAKNINYEYLDGQTRDRQERVDHFQENPECKVFLISLKAGGVGLNLTAADYVFLLDPWWNPASEAQAIDRAHRIGQDKKVFAYRIIARNTIEEKILSLQEKKKNLADSIITADNSVLKNLSEEDLKVLLS